MQFLPFFQIIPEFMNIIGPGIAPGKADNRHILNSEELEILARQFPDREIVRKRLDISKYRYGIVADGGGTLSIRITAEIPLHIVSIG